MSSDNTSRVHTSDAKEAEKDNEGARELRSRFPHRGGIAEVAKLCDCDSSIVSRWFSGERKPDTKMRAALEDKVGIHWRLFDHDVDVKNEEPAA